MDILLTWSAGMSGALESRDGFVGWVAVEAV